MHTNIDKRLFQQFDLRTADDVLHELSPHRGATLWAHHGEDKAWLFRGAFDAAWPLQPSAMRDKPLSQYLLGQAVPIPRTSMSVSDRLEMEQSLVMQFAAGADRVGFPFPGDTPELRDEEATTFDPLNFPPVRYRGLFAFAQHYRVPTRFLDWTPRPLVAAYFAAAEAAEEQTSYKTRRLMPERISDRCAIWALQQQGLRQLTGDWDPTVKIVSAPAALVPNLAAQAGRFTLVVYRNHADAKSKDPPNLDALFDGKELPEDEALRCAPLLIKFTFPAKQAGRLLYLLSFFDVTAATVYPGLAGVEQAMFERALMPRPAFKDEGD